MGETTHVEPRPDGSTHDLTMFSNAGGMVEIVTADDGRITLRVAEPMPAPVSRITLTAEQARHFLRVALLGSFTWADVDALRARLAASGWPGAPDEQEQDERARKAVDRIAALLPPREGT